jgi:two-component system, OmpR family, sensor kinase
VELRELAEHAADDARAMAPDRDVSVQAAEAVQVRADSDQLRQVLANLLRNAIMHTPAGSPIEITVRREPDWALLSVSDHGPGLPPGAGDQVFERFWRNEGGRRRGPGGAGLGLAIVSGIVSAHHGSVVARNAPGGGAEFEVRLPMLAAGSPDPESESRSLGQEPTPARG